MAEAATESVAEMERPDKSPLMLEIEEREGEPLELTLIRLFNRHNGNLRKIGQDLGVDLTTVHKWLTRLNIERVTIAVLR